MNEFEQPFTAHETGQRKFRPNTTARPLPATWSGRREFELVMSWSFQPEETTIPRLRLDGEYIYWSLN